MNMNRGEIPSRSLDLSGSINEAKKENLLDDALTLKDRADFPGIHAPLRHELSHGHLKEE